MLPHSTCGLIQKTCPHKVDAQSLGLLLREHPQEEVTILGGLKGRWYHQVLSWGQSDPAGHFPQVHVGAGVSRGLAAQEEVLAQMCIRVTLQLCKAMGRVSFSLEFSPTLSN